MYRHPSASELPGFAATLRPSDTVARLGGDEFVVLAEGLSLAAGPELVAERLLQVLTEPFLLGDNDQTKVSITASIGVATGRRDSDHQMSVNASGRLESRCHTPPLLSDEVNRPMIETQRGARTC
jgi:hypothetical protein